MLKNKQIVLLRHPMGAPKPSDFELVEKDVPEVGQGEILLKTRYFSLDPYMRARMNESRIKSYVEGFKLGQPLDGHAICEVVKSNHPEFKEGDIVMSDTGWQSYVVIKPLLITGISRTHEGVTILPKDIKPSLYLGVLGMPGLTAWHGVNKMADLKPGETVVVSSALGPVGSMVGQLAKSKGMRVVGIAGGPEKCRFVVDTLGFDACVDRKSKTFEKDLGVACPKGIDFYFENVGGRVLNAVVPLMNLAGRIAVCGQISSYNAASTINEKNFSLGQIIPRIKAFFQLLLGINRLPIFMISVLRQRLRVQGVVIVDHFDEYPDFIQEVVPMVRSGQIKYKETIVKGIENAPEAFSNMITGKSAGKVVVEI